MGDRDKCCVGGCNNDLRYPERYVIRSHVNKLGFHKPFKSEDVIRSWCIQVQKGRKDLKIGKSRESVIVCSNHFVDGKPTRNNLIPIIMNPLAWYYFAFQDNILWTAKGKNGTNKSTSKIGVSLACFVLSNIVTIKLFFRENESKYFSKIKCWPGCYIIHRHF